jgi:hypothetical protein
VLDSFTELGSLRASLHEKLTGEPLPEGGGLGLQLAAHLALEIAWYANGSVKHVWAQFPIPHA